MGAMLQGGTEGRCVGVRVLQRGQRERESETSKSVEFLGGAKGRRAGEEEGEEKRVSLL